MERIFVPCYKSLLAKLEITEMDRCTLIEQSVTVIEQLAANCSIRVG